MSGTCWRWHLPGGEPERLHCPLSRGPRTPVGDMLGRGLMSPASTRPRSRRNFAEEDRQTGHVFHATAYAINGVSGWAQKWVESLEGLTCCHHLDALTLLPLRNTLSDMLLFKRRAAWCPQCYEEDLKLGTVYERLLWALRGVTVCPLHAKRLEEKCPSCHKALPPLAVHSRPGRCSSCGRWLGVKSGPPRLGGNTPRSDYESYVAAATGDLLARCSAAGTLSRAIFSGNLRICIDQLASGNGTAFADFTHTSRSAIRAWVAGTMRIRLDALIRVSFHVGISAGTLPTSRCLADMDWAAAKAHFQSHDRGVKVTRSLEDVKRLLNAALRDRDSPSLSELSERLGYKRHTRLYQVDRSLCRRITAKHRACKRTHWWRKPGAKRICEIDAIRSALEQSLAQDPPVPTRRIASTAWIREWRFYTWEVS